MADIDALRASLDEVIAQGPATDRIVAADVVAAAQAADLIGPERFEEILVLIGVADPDRTEAGRQHLREDETGSPWAPSLARMLTRFGSGRSRSLDVSPGWFPLLARFEARASARIPDYGLGQVKEKFGTLCCYLAGLDKPEPDDLSPEAADRRWATGEVQRLAAEAEWESARVCDVTGGPGIAMTRGHWVATRDPLTVEAGWRAVEGIEFSADLLGEDATARLAKRLRAVEAERNHLLRIIDRLVQARHGDAAS